MKKDDWVFIWFFPQLYVTLPSNICPTNKRYVYGKAFPMVR